MKNEFNKIREALKMIEENSKKVSFEERMEKATLANKVQTLKSQFLWYVDKITLNYRKTQFEKQNPGCWNDHIEDYPEWWTPTELSKKQREDTIEIMEYFIRDIQECISHLKK